jgi:dsDNA-specific endonuclease/ATPase MutS2
MSMLNIDGQLVASALLNQQSGDVFNGILQHRREMRAAEMQQQQQFADQQHYARLVAKYNNLADRYNHVLADNKRVDAAYAEALAEKDRQIARLTAENAQLAEDYRFANESRERGWAAVTWIKEGLERNKIEIGDAWPPELKRPSVP